VVAGVLAALALVVVFDRPALSATWRAVARIRWEWVAFAAVAEAASMVAAAAGHRRLLRAGGDRIRLRTVVAVVYAGTAIASSVPFAGTQLAAAYSFRQYHRRGIELAVAGWALAIGWLLSTFSFATVLAVGAATSGSLLASLLGLATSLAFLVPPVAAVLALRYPRARRAVIRWSRALVGLARRVTGRPGGDPVATLGDALDRMAGLRLPVRQYAGVYAAYLGNWAGDIACFLCAIKAIGAPVPWHGVLLAYGAGITADSLGITPGGLGLVEAALTAALIACGLRSGQALSAMLVYRLVSCWMLLAAGWVTMVFLARSPRRGPEAEAPTSPAGVAP
jgi:uncharacterized protein (TIRG00374 family)